MPNIENKSEQAIRLEKLALLQKSGIDSYPAITKRKQSIAEIKNIKLSEWTAGKIISIRDHGKSVFVDLQDESGKIQVYFKADLLGEKKFDLVKLLDAGDYIEIKGELFTTKMGEITIKAEDLNILAKSLLPLPDQWYGLKDTEIRYRKRFLDLLINTESKQYLITRSKTILALRSFLENQGFIEIETPTLQPIPGGAAAKPFVTHYNILDSDFYLRISPELYLKRLIVGGFEKVFEIGKMFRNEGLSHMHNPEFTELEFYWAYQDYNSLMKFTEKLISEVIREIKSSLEITYQKQRINFKPPYPKVKFSDLIQKECDIDINKFHDFESLKKEIDNQGIKLETKEIKVWAKLVDELYKKVVRPKIIQPIFLIDHPAELLPLAKANELDPTKAQVFQLVACGGFEILKAYSELNDPIIQEKRLDEQIKMRKAGWEESEMKDENFLEALKYGMPPTAGWGMGIDRFVMILTDNYSIKEVIPFPTLKLEK